MAKNNRYTKDNYQFEKIPLPAWLTGLFVLLPLYVYILPNVILVRSVYRYWDYLDGLSPDMINLLINLAYQLAMFLLLLAAFYTVTRQSFRDLKSRRFSHFMKWYALGYAVFYGGTFLSGIVYMLIEGIGASPENQEAVVALLKASPILMFISAALLGPFVEEMIFRLIVFRTVRLLGKIPAVIVSAAAFGFMHVATYVFAGDTHELIGAIQYVTMGLVLGILYEKRKNILLCVFVHATHNAISLILLLVAGKLGIM